MAVGSPVNKVLGGKLGIGDGKELVSVVGAFINKIVGKVIGVVDGSGAVE